MNQQQTKNQRLILIIFAMSFIPFLIAWYLKEHPQTLVTHTNNGELITPPVPTDLIEFTGLDQFSRNNMSEIAGHWVLLNVIAGNDCNQTCLDAIHKTKQIVLMLNKDLTRTRRLVAVFNPPPETVSAKWWEDDSRLLRAQAMPELKQKLTTIRKAEIPEGMLFLMDPLGNLMMQYEPGFDPYKVKDDLKKLLMISQIG
jgi:hypothetical protein